MLIKRKIFFLKFFETVLDDDSAIAAIASGQYDYVNFVSHRLFDLGDKVSRKEKNNVKIKLSGRDRDSLLGSFEKTTRRHIRKTETIDNLYFKCPDDNFAEGYRLFCDFEKSQGRRPVKAEILKATKLFSAYYNGKIVSAIFAADSFPILRTYAIFSGRLAVNRASPEYQIIGYASRRLIYESCCYGLAHGYEYFDLGSINLQEGQKAGINEFKLLFRPEIGKEYHYIYKGPRFSHWERIKKFLRL